MKNEGCKPIKIWGKITPKNEGFRWVPMVYIMCILQGTGCMPQQRMNHTGKVKKPLPHPNYVEQWQQHPRVKGCMKSWLVQVPGLWFRGLWNNQSLYWVCSSSICMKLVKLVGGFFPTHPKNMRTSNWIISQGIGGEKIQKYLSCHHLDLPYFYMWYEFIVYTCNFKKIFHTWNLGENTSNKWLMKQSIPL